MSKNKETQEPVEIDEYQVPVISENTSLAEVNDIQYLSTAFNSKLLPSWVRSVDQAIVVALYGKELGLPPMTSFKVIYLVDNVPTLNAKGLGMILRKLGIEYYQTKDAEKVCDDNKKLINPIAITEIKGKRKGDSDWHYVQFTWEDATNAGLTGKDNWKKYPKAMLYARCLSKFANIVAPDVMCGFYLADELENSGKIAYDDEGNIIQL